MPRCPGLAGCLWAQPEKQCLSIISRYAGTALFCLSEHFRTISSKSSRQPQRSRWAILRRSLMLIPQAEGFRVLMIFKSIYNVTEFQAPREPQDVARPGPGRLLVGVGLSSLAVRAAGQVAMTRGSSGDGPLLPKEAVTESGPLACLASDLSSAIYQPSDSGWASSPRESQFSHL